MPFRVTSRPTTGSRLPPVARLAASEAGEGGVRRHNHGRGCHQLARGHRVRLADPRKILHLPVATDTSPAVLLLGQQIGFGNEADHVSGVVQYRAGTDLPLAHGLNDVIEPARPAPSVGDAHRPKPEPQGHRHTPAGA